MRGCASSPTWRYSSLVAFVLRLCRPLFRVFNGPSTGPRILPLRHKSGSVIHRRGRSAFDQFPFLIGFYRKIRRRTQPCGSCRGLSLRCRLVAALAWQWFRLSFATMRQISPASAIPWEYAYSHPLGAVIMRCSRCSSRSCRICAKRPSHQETAYERRGPIDGYSSHWWRSVVPRACMPVAFAWGVISSSISYCPWNSPS